MSPALVLYTLLTRMLEPLAPRLLDARVKQGKEDNARVDERLGLAGVARPEGDLVWLHGVSVGETLSLLPVVERLQKARPDLAILVTSGTLTSATLLAQRLPAGVIHQFAPVDAPSAVAAFLDHWRPSVGVFVESLDIQPEIREAPDALPLAEGPVTIAFDHVSFAYGAPAEGMAPTLSDVSLSVRPGETVALVGPSGGGKSTILALLPRFYDITAGAVTFNGVDIRDIRLHDLRKNIALVTQEPFLFDDTVAANIAYGRPDATPEQIQAAAASAAAHGFISHLPEGYATRVGEGGMRLSGGQRQRVAIARAFLKDAPILLLDEATSALDTESEAKVQAALERLMQGRATLMIAHRLSTVMNADRIHVIEAGRIVETGTHAELTAAGGLYSRLARQQSLDGTPPLETVV